MRVVDFSDGYETVGAPSSAGAWGLPDGSEASPGAAWASDADTGFWRPGANSMAASCGGVALTYWDTNGFHIGTSGSLIGRERLTVLQSVASGNSGANNYAAWFRYSNLTDTVFSQDQISVSMDWRRTITVDVTDTSSYANNLFAYHVFNVAATKTYTHAGVVANVRLGAPANSGAGSLAIANFAHIYIEGGSLSTGTRKLGVYIGAQTGATYNAALTDNGSFTSDYAIHFTNTAPSYLAGRVGFGTAAGSDTFLRVGGSSLTSGTEQYGVYMDTVFSSAATGGVYGVVSLPQLANASFTAGYALCFSAGGVVKVGGTATLTRAVNYHGSSQTAGTNNAFMTDNVSFSGNWFVNSTSTRPSLFTGPMCFGIADVASAASITSLSASASIIRLTGSTATTLHGIGAGKAGQLLILVNLSGQNLTIKNSSGSASAADQITTQTGADVASTGDSAHLFVYDGTASLWRYLGGQV